MAAEGPGRQPQAPHVSAVPDQPPDQPDPGRRRPGPLADLAAEARRQLAELAANDPAKAALDARLAAVLKGNETPKNDAERLQLGVSGL